MAYGLWRMDHRPSTVCHEPSALSHGRSSDTYGGEIADGVRDEFLLVLVVRTAARRVERARGAVEIAAQQKRRRDAERRAIGRGIALERADEQRVCEIGFPREHRDAAGAGEIVGVGVLGNLDEHRLDVRMMTGA